MNHLPPLHVHFLFHPKSELARGLAEGFVAEWMPEPGTPGLRIPTFLTPTSEEGLPPGELPLDDADHCLVVLLVDRVMARRQRGQGKQWSAFARGLMAAHPSGDRHQILPVILDQQGFDFDELVSSKHAVVAYGEDTDPKGVRAEISFAISVRALLLLRGDAVPSGRLVAPVTLFVSHAKADLDRDKQDPVRMTQIALHELPVREWFDARDIRYGESFEQEIREGIARADAVVLFGTDKWATRPWCVLEGLVAKEVGIPVLVVDALQEGEGRSFAYGGNSRVLRWGTALRPPTGEGLLAWQKEAIAQGKRVIAAGVMEALRRLHAGVRLRGLAQPGDIVLDAAPEPARFAYQEPSGSYLYPDPPVGRGEQRLLQHLRPDARFETPITRFSQRRADRPMAMVAVSISESPDLAGLGLTDRHQQLVTDEVHLYLLMAGLQIVYGGRLDPKVTDDPNNFTLRLFNLVRSQRGLAKTAGAGTLHPILNMAPWPLWKNYTDDELDLFGTVAELDEIPLPDIGLSEADLGALPNGFVVPNTPLRLYAWARALTHMRELATERTAARLCIGGRIEGYKGRLAGLIEEPYIQLRRGKPLYLVGALGGCTRLVIDLLEGRSRPEMSTENARAKVVAKVDGVERSIYDELVGLYEQYGGDFPSREAIAEEIRQIGAKGPAAALHNGLDDEENRLLFRTTDPIRIAELVLTGLERLGI